MEWPEFSFKSTFTFAPSFGDVDTWRDWVKNNSRVQRVPVKIFTNETWLPLVLSQVGFFESNGQVKKNRPDLWRDVVPGETITINKWADITITHDCPSVPLERESS